MRQCIAQRLRMLGVHPAACSYIRSGWRPCGFPDEQFRGWVREAYAVGQGAHMLRPLAARS